MIFYPVPDDEGYPVFVCISEEEAIFLQKKSVPEGFGYDNDQDALEDFMIVHWAWKE